MPSIFNHDHSCWGVKRSCYNFFNYAYTEDFQERKVSDVSVTPNSNNPVTNTNPVQYSVSANGYYGYQPHIHEQAIDSNAMEIEDSVHNNILHVNGPVDCQSNMFDSNVLSSNNHISRKRQYREEYTENMKRMRQEDAVTMEQTPEQESQQVGGGPRMKHRRWPDSLDMHDFSNENTTQLLKQTHGCEMYLYERNCDY